MSPKLEEGQREQALVLSEQGLTTRQIAKQLGISKTCAGKITQKTLRSYPIIARKGFSKEQIWDMYFEQGMNTYNIEEKTCINHETIRSFLHQHGGYKPVGGRNKLRYRLKHGGEILKHSHGYIQIGNYTFTTCRQIDIDNSRIEICCCPPLLLVFLRWWLVLLRWGWQ